MGLQKRRGHTICVQIHGTGSQGVKLIRTKNKLTHGQTLYTAPKDGKKIHYAPQDLSSTLDPQNN